MLITFTKLNIRILLKRDVLAKRRWRAEDVVVKETFWVSIAYFKPTILLLNALQSSHLQHDAYSAKQPHSHRNSLPSQAPPAHTSSASYSQLLQTVHQGAPECSDKRGSSVTCYFELLHLPDSAVNYSLRGPCNSAELSVYKFWCLLQ